MLTSCRGCFVQEWAAYKVERCLHGIYRVRINHCLRLKPVRQYKFLTSCTEAMAICVYAVPGWLAGQDRRFTMEIRFKAQRRSDRYMQMRSCPRFSFQLEAVRDSPRKSGNYGCQPILPPAWRAWSPRCLNSTQSLTLFFSLGPFSLSFLKV